MTAVGNATSYEASLIRDDRGNTVSRVHVRYGNVRVLVQGEGDHPQTRRARARRAVRAVLGAEWDVTEYLGAQLMTHVNSRGERYGSLHHYTAVRIAA